MKTHVKSTQTVARRLVLVSILLGLTVVVAAAFTVSRQREKNVEPKEVGKGFKVELKSRGTSETINMAGQDVQVNPQTGEIQELTPEEARKLAEGLKRLIHPSAEGVTQVRHDDGSVSMNLEGRFQNVTVARVNKDGSVSHSCVDTPEAAGKFFGIDPKLIRHEEVAPVKKIKNRDN